MQNITTKGRCHAPNIMFPPHDNLWQGHPFCKGAREAKSLALRNLQEWSFFAIFTIILLKIDLTTCLCGNSHLVGDHLLVFVFKEFILELLKRGLIKAIIKCAHISSWLADIVAKIPSWIPHHSSTTYCVLHFIKTNESRRLPQLEMVFPSCLLLVKEVSSVGHSVHKSIQRARQTR